MGVRDRCLEVGKTFLEKLGIFAMRHRHVPFGVNYPLDVSGLSRMWSHPIRTIFDVGANVGQTSERLLGAFRDARIFAFEPHPPTCALLKEKFSTIKRFQAVNSALGDRAGKVEFFEYENSAINSLTPNARYALRSAQRARTTEVDCTTLDAFCTTNQLSNIDFLKIDTEGYELVVLHGAASLLAARQIRFIYVEYNDIGNSPKACGGSLAEIDSFLRTFGFRFVTSYTDYIIPDADFLVVSNALFALPPEAADRIPVSGRPVISPFAKI